MSNEKKSVFLKLMDVQNKLKAPKSQINKFGGYKYRNCEDILEALKPLLAEEKALVLLSDKVEYIEGRYYIRALAKFVDAETGNTIEVSGQAREEESKKGMDASQLTGSTSSYARKYALNGLFAIDDTKDADTLNTHGKEPQTVTRGNDYKVTIAQLRSLYTIASEKGFDKDAVKGHVEKRFSKEPKDLTQTEYKRAVEGYQKKENKPQHEAFLDFDEYNGN